MRILIISKYFFPQITPRAFRTTELVKEFARQGHEVTAIFPHDNYDYSTFSDENGVTIKNLGKLKFKNIEFKGCKLEFIFRKVLNKTLEVFFEFPDIELMFKVAKILKKEKEFDLLISIAVPHSIHWGVSIVWNKKSSTSKYWIADCGDPFMKNKVIRQKKLFYFKFLEKHFCRKTDFITIPFEGAKQGYYPEFQNKLKVIPQGFNFNSIKLSSFVKTQEYPIFGYAGAFYPNKRDPKILMQYLIKSNRKFKFIVYTSQPEFLLEYKEILKENLEINNYIPREELLQILSKMDFLINFDNNNRIHNPSKLIDYAFIGRPILNISNDTNLEILDQFFDGNYEAKMELEDYHKYDIENIAKEFLRII